MFGGGPVQTVVRRKGQIRALNEHRAPRPSPRAGSCTSNETRNAMDISTRDLWFLLLLLIPIWFMLNARFELTKRWGINEWLHHWKHHE
jgi:hypothetical protein